MDNPSTKICHGCQQLISANDNFCPHCGYAMKPQEIKISFSGQLIAFVVSLFLPPFGLWYVFKYRRLGSPEAKRAAIICAILTAVSIIYTIYLFNSIMSSATQSIDSFNELVY